LKGLLKSDCEYATYDLQTDVAYLRDDPWIYYDIHELTGDSVDLFFIDKTATRLLVFEGNGHVMEIAGNWTIWQASQAEAV